MLSSALSRFRLISILEGTSYLLLLFVAMPLKYIANNPIPVKITGMIHGILFVSYILLLLFAALERKWSIRFQALAVIISLVPFGAFFFDSHLRPKENK